MSQWGGTFEHPKQKQAFSNAWVTEKWFSYLTTKTYVVDTQNNHLIEKVLLSTQNIC